MKRNTPKRNVTKTRSNSRQINLRALHRIDGGVGYQFDKTVGASPILQKIVWRR